MSGQSRFEKVAKNQMFLTHLSKIMLSTESEIVNVFKTSLKSIRNYEKIGQGSYRDTTRCRIFKCNEIPGKVNI